jgi:hypothetical protein
MGIIIISQKLNSIVGVIIIKGELGNGGRYKNSNGSIKLKYNKLELNQFLINLNINVIACVYAIR